MVWILPNLMAHVDCCASRQALDEGDNHDDCTASANLLTKPTVRVPAPAAIRIRECRFEHEYGSNYL